MGSNTDLEGASASLRPATASSPLCTHRGATAVSAKNSRPMCFAAVCLGTLVDDMLRLLEIRITSIWTWGHKVVADRLIPARVRKKSEILAELRRLVSDKTLSDEAFRTKANTLLLADQPNPLRSRAADVARGSVSQCEAHPSDSPAFHQTRSTGGRRRWEWTQLARWHLS